MSGVRALLVASLVWGLAASAAFAQAPASVEWSGFYVSGLIGATRSHGQLQTTVGVSQYLNATDTRQFDRAGNTDLNEWRPAGGLAGGYGYQFGKLLVGIEAGINSLLLDDETTVTEFYQSLPGTQFTLRQSVSADWMATLRPRLGWAQDNWLAYVSGGLAVTRLTLDTLFTDNAFSGFSQSSDTKFVAGWSLGFGAEYALDGNWSLRGDYSFTRFGQMRSSSETTSTNNSGGSLNHTAELETHAVMVGLTYRFKGF